MTDNIGEAASLKNLSFLYLSKENPNHITEEQIAGVRKLYDSSFPLRCKCCLFFIKQYYC